MSPPLLQLEQLRIPIAITPTITVGIASYGNTGFEPTRDIGGRCGDLRRFACANARDLERYESHLLPLTVHHATGGRLLAAWARDELAVNELRDDSPLGDSLTDFDRPLDDLLPMHRFEYHSR